MNLDGILQHFWSQCKVERAIKNMMAKYLWFKYLVFVVIRVESAFYIRNSVEPKFVLDLADQNHCADAKVIMCPQMTRASQLWEFYNLTMIRNVYSGYFLDLKGGYGAGTDIIVWPGHGCKNQQWAHQLDNTMKNRLNLYLDIADDMKDPGAQLIGFYHTGNSNQQFDLVNAGSLESKNRASGTCL